MYRYKIKLEPKNNVIITNEIIALAHKIESFYKKIYDNYAIYAIDIQDTEPDIYDFFMECYDIVCINMCRTFVNNLTNNEKDILKLFNITRE